MENILQHYILILGKFSRQRLDFLKYLKNIDIVNYFSCFTGCGTYVASNHSETN